MVRAILVQMAAAGMLFSLVLFLTDRSHLVVGFMLGLAASMFNCILLGRQLKKTTELPMEKAIAQVQTGWFVRLFLAILLLALSALFPEINFLAALAGFFVFQIVLVLRAAFAFMRGRPKDRQERGE